MSVVNMLNKYTNLTAEVRGSLLIAGKQVNLETEMKKAGTITTKSFSNGDRYNEWWKITQDKLATPVAMDIHTMDTEDLDEYTFSTEVEKLSLVAGHVVGNFEDSILLPVLDYKDTESTFADMLAASMACALNNQFNMAYAYLRFGQLLIKYARERSRTYMQSNIGDGKTIAPYQL